MNLMAASDLSSFERPANRRVALSLSICAAALLNCCALGAFGGIVEQWHVFHAPPQRTLWVTTVPIRPKLAEASPAESATENAGPAAKTAPPSAKQPTREITPSASIEEPPPIRFYSAAEVDMPAAPESDWNLDAALFDAAQLDRLVFDVFIDDAGVVIACAILEPPTIDDSLRHSIEERLQKTVTLPAVRDGVNVASVRRIEIGVQQ